MTTVRITKPSKTAMQSGKAKTKAWRVEFETRDPLTPEFLMGWVASRDTNEQLHLDFSSLEEALQYAKSRNFNYTVTSPTFIEHPSKSYGINFTNPRIRG